MTDTEVHTTDVKALAWEVARQVGELVGAVSRLPIVTDDGPLPRQPHVERAFAEAHELLRETPLTEHQKWQVASVLIGYVSPEIELEEMRDALTGRLGPVRSLRAVAQQTRTRPMRLTPWSTTSKRTVHSPSDAADDWRPDHHDDAPHICTNVLHDPRRSHVTPGVHTVSGGLLRAPGSDCYALPQRVSRPVGSARIAGLEHPVSLTRHSRIAPSRSLSLRIGRDSDRLGSIGRHRPPLVGIGRESAERESARSARPYFSTSKNRRRSGAVTPVDLR